MRSSSFGLANESNGFRSVLITLASNEVMNPTTITSSRTITPASATLVSRSWRRTPVAPAIPVSATAPMTRPAVTTSPPASVNAVESGVR
jgi:hypothetical protein